MGVEQGRIDRQQVHLYLQGDFSSLSAERRIVAIEALAAVLNVSPEAIELNGVYEGSIIFDLGLPFSAIEQLLALLEGNSPQLRLLGVEKVLLEKVGGYIEEWAIQNGTFYQVTSTPPIFTVDPGDTSRVTFSPIPGMWRFHLIYMMVTLTMAWSAFPYPLYASLLLVSLVCGAGIVLAYFNRFMFTQVLALAIGLGSPIIVFATLTVVQTVLLLALLTFGFALMRRSLF